MVNHYLLNNMKTKTKIKKYIKKNSGAILIVSTIAIIGIAANINLMLMETPAMASVNFPKHSKAKSPITTEWRESTTREITAYNAGDPSQTDASPCIAANGENICSALALGYKRCAANFVPFGTTLDIEHYGRCLVVDRMNSRYKNRVDIAMKAEEKERAVKFGLQRLKVEIIK